MEDQRRAALTSPRGLSAQPPGRAGLGAEARASVLARRESGKNSAAAEEARDFFLPLCFVARKERGFRAPPKRTPETGASRGAISMDPRGGRKPWLTARNPETGRRR